jgi:restriction system protein
VFQTKGLFVRLKMAERSIFATLLRSPWWISVAIAAAVALAGRYIVYDKYAVPVITMALPFLVIAAISFWKKRDIPSAGRIDRTVEAVMAMSWRDFSAVMEEAYKREGFAVARANGAADFVLVKAGRTTLVSCKRWKAVSHGVEPLRELVAEREAQEASEARYVCITRLADKAQRCLEEEGVVLIDALELAKLLRLPRN